MKPLTSKQQTVVDIIKREGKVSIPYLIKTLNFSIKAMKAQVFRLERDNHIHVVDWAVAANGGAMKVYSAGAGVNVKLDRAAFKAKRNQDAERAARTKRNTFDPYAPLAQNNGWVSTIHSLDYAIQHGDHIKYMARFQPRPDVAAAWMFNQGE